MLKIIANLEKGVDEHKRRTEENDIEERKNEAENQR